MNRKNLTAALLAGLAGAAGIVGSAQASLLSPGDLFAPEVSDIVVVMNAPNAEAQLLGANKPDTLVIHNNVVEEVSAIIGATVSSDEVVRSACAISQRNMKFSANSGDMDSVSRGDVVPTDLVGNDGGNDYWPRMTVVPTFLERTPQSNHFTQAQLVT